MSDPDATSFVHQAMPLCALLGVTADSVQAEEVVLRIAWRPEITTTGGAMHGGTIMALADAAGAAAAYLNLPEGAAATTTIESKTNFLGAASEGDAVATARPLHVGRSTMVIETEVTSAGRLVAKTTQTQAVLGG